MVNAWPGAHAKAPDVAGHRSCTQSTAPAAVLQCSGPRARPLAQPPRGRCSPGSPTPSRPRSQPFAPHSRWAACIATARTGHWGCADPFPPFCLAPLCLQVCAMYRHTADTPDMHAHCQASGALWGPAGGFPPAASLPLRRASSHPFHAPSTAADVDQLVKPAPHDGAQHYEWPLARAASSGCCHAADR
jgi:hypothetical protein